MSDQADSNHKLLMRGRFTFSLKQALVAAFIGISIAIFVAVSNLS